MRTSIPSMLMLPLLLGLTPLAVFAQEPPTCGDSYDAQLSNAQRTFLQVQGFELEVPPGEVELIRRCDINEDNSVDINDIRAISRNRNQPATDPDDPMDWDRNGVINLLDARGCQRACSLPRCAIQTIAPDTPTGGTAEPAECFQKDDFDGDGVDDFVAVTEDTSEEVPEGYNLSVVILSEDENNQVQGVTFPYTGQSASATGGVITQHLSVQPPGVVDLNPGTLTLTEPAVVSYRNGEPHVIFYFVDGQVRRAFYRIDD